MVFWTCYSDRVSKKHTHEFDEYMVCVSGQYTAILKGEEFVLNPGDELLIRRVQNSGESVLQERELFMRLEGNGFREKNDKYVKRIFLNHEEYQTNKTSIEKYINIFHRNIKVQISLN